MPSRLMGEDEEGTLATLTAHPTANWLTQQIVEAFPWETAPRYLIRDRDAAFGPVFRSRLDGIGILEASHR